VAKKSWKVRYCETPILIVNLVRSVFRDDRCVSDHGREVWFPYIDEELVSFIQSLPMSLVRLFTWSMFFILILFAGG
jgi:hypothetical protein